MNATQPICGLQEQESVNARVIMIINSLLILQIEIYQVQHYDLLLMFEFAEKQELLTQHAQIFMIKEILMEIMFAKNVEQINGELMFGNVKTVGHLKIVQMCIIPDMENNGAVDAKEVMVFYQDLN